MPNLITLTGPSCSGKSEILKIITKQDPKYKILPKYTTREKRLDDDESIICVDSLPKECDYVYEQYGNKYGFSSKMIAEYLKEGKIPILIINDVKILRDLQEKFGTSMKSYFIHREKLTRAKLIEIYRKTRGTPTPEVIEKRYEVVQKIYSMYTDNIELFDNIIFNVENDLEEVEKIVKQLLETASMQKRLGKLVGNKIFVLSGGPGSGKKSLIQGASSLGCLQVQKYTDRERNPNDSTEMIFKDDVNFDLESCDLQYENHGNHYYINTNDMWQNLIMTNKHQVLVCSDVNVLKQLKSKFGDAIISIYVHSDMKPEEWVEKSSQLGNKIDYSENTAADYYSAFENYAQNFGEYDKSFIYTGDQRELMRQFAGMLGINYKKEEKGVTKD